MNLYMSDDTHKLGIDMLQWTVIDVTVREHIQITNFTHWNSNRQTIGPQLVQNPAWAGNLCPQPAPHISVQSTSPRSNLARNQPAPAHFPQPAPPRGN